MRAHTDREQDWRGNPRLFAAPKTMATWAAKGLLGEWLFLNRHEVPSAAHHLRTAHILTGLPSVGQTILIDGLIIIIDP